MASGRSSTTMKRFRLNCFANLALIIYLSSSYALASHNKHKHEENDEEGKEESKIKESITALPIIKEANIINIESDKEVSKVEKKGKLSVIFYSFFVSMDKSAGYAYPFANKLCYMAQYDYKWLLDVVPKKNVPNRHGKMAPTWYKPHGIQRWLSRVDYLIYLDMDLVVKRTDVNFVEKYATGADLTVTDHNRALNNGAFVLKNSRWGKKFLQRWTSLTDSGFDFPFSDNGSFIEAILSFLPGYSKNCMQKTTVKANAFLDCAQKLFEHHLGKFDGKHDRFLQTEDGGVVRFVAPKDGFNSHEYNSKRPGMGWAQEACFNKQQGFILHTKEWKKEVPEGSAECAASQSGALTTAGGEHLFGKWGGCSVSKPDCHDKLTLRTGATIDDNQFSDINYPKKMKLNHTKLNHTKLNQTSLSKKPPRKKKHLTGLNQYVSPDKTTKRKHSNSTKALPHPHSMLYKGDDAVIITNFSSPVKCNLVPTSAVTKLGPFDRYGVLAIPKTATTSLTKLLMKAELSSSCGGVLWQSTEPNACPMSLQTSIKLKPTNWVATEKNGRPKKLSHVLHPDFIEVHKAWQAHSGRLVGNLKMVVVLRDPVSRLFSAYTHGKNFNVHNQVSPGDRGDRSKQSLTTRMKTWRSFYWSYRDYNDTTLLLTSNTSNFEEFAALPYLPTHNQQTRMLAGVKSTVIVDDNVLNTAKTNLCTIECVGLLENLEPVVQCVSRQLGLKDQAMPEKNLKGAKSTSTISESAKKSAEKHGWADLLLHEFAADLVKDRHH